MLKLVVKIIVSPICIITDILNMFTSLLMWDARYIGHNSDSLRMLWNSEIKKIDVKH